MMNLATGGQIAPEPGDTFYGIDQRKMSNQEILAMMTEKKRRHARTSLISFTEMTMPRYKSGWFNRQLAYELELFWRGIQDGIMPHLMVFAPPRHGKLCADDTPVPTPKGYQRHGDLKIGDQVYAADGSIANVLAVSEKTPSDTRVEFTNGEVIYCHENHEWTVYDRGSRKRDWFTYETNHFTRTTKFGKKVRLYQGAEGERGCHYQYQLPLSGALENSEKELVMDPYTLGAWLGDGSRATCAITHAPEETEVIAHIVSKGYKVSRVSTHKSTGVLTTGFGGKGGPNRAGRMTKELQALNLYGCDDKHIPEQYFTSSIPQRLELMAGLIDTDGSVCRKTGRVRFTTCELPLAQSVLDLATSLGFRPYMSTVAPALSTSGIQGTRDIYVVGFQPTLTIPCKLPRKQNQKISTQRRIAIKSVTHDPKGKVGHCIQIDREDGLYIVGKKHIVTHNSELFSRRLPAWIFGQAPDTEMIAASHTSGLASRMCKDVQRIMDEPSYQSIFPGIGKRGPITAGGRDRMRNSELFEVSAPYRGVYKAAGVGGGITGLGADVGIIDDPVKDGQEARSVTTQDSVETWYKSTFYTRLSDRSGVLLGHTRWSVQDLAGRLLAEMAKGSGPKWRIVDFPAISLENEYFYVYGDSFTDYGSRFKETGEKPVEKHLLRKEGEPLHVERFSLDRLLQIKAATSEGGVWDSLYMQSPVILGGNLIKDDYWQFYDQNAIPQMEYSFITADTAMKTTQRADYSVFTCFGVKHGSLYVLDMVRGKWEAPDLEVICKTFWDKQRAMPNRGMMRGLHIEDASSGTGLIQKLKRTTGIPVLEYKPDKDKYTRVLDALPYIKAGRMLLPFVAPWLSDLRTECRQFSADPKANVHDDMVDTITAAAQIKWNSKVNIFDVLYDTKQK